ncbi:Uncharacterized protein FKW44_008281, partial [Caligus rogercresseyi]
TSGQLLTQGKFVDAKDLRAIMISAAARYSALSLKIPNTNGPTWNYGSDVVRYFPSSSPRLARVLARIISKFKKLKNSKTSDCLLF